MKALLWEAANDFAGTIADHIGRTQSDRHRCPSGNIAGSRFEEGTVLCGLPARSHERRSRREKAALSENTAATGASAVREDLRAVRFCAAPRYVKRALEIARKPFRVRPDLPARSPAT